MGKASFLLAMAVMCLSTAQAKDYNIVSYSAKSDATVLSTHALQQAIDDCSQAKEISDRKL